MVKFSILDLAQISYGNTVAQTLENSVHLVQKAEELGYYRYWVGEHHGAQIASAAPIVLIGYLAGVTNTIRIGSGAVLTGPLSAAGIVEHFGTLAELYPQRIDMGLGRSNDRIAAAQKFLANFSPQSCPAHISKLTTRDIDNVIIPDARDIDLAIDDLHNSWSTIITFPSGANGGKFIEQINDIIAFIKGIYRSTDGTQIHVIPGESTDLIPYILGSAAGESSLVAANLGLPFVANYHLASPSILEAVESYRNNFRAGMISQPYLIVSADVLIADTQEYAEHLALSALPWIRDIRKGKGAPKVYEPQDSQLLDDYDKNLIADRVVTRIVGDPRTAVQRLSALAKLTKADELMITTLTYDIADKVRSFELLAQLWD